MDPDELFSFLSQDGPADGRDQITTQESRTKKKKRKLAEETNGDQQPGQDDPSPAAALREDADAEPAAKKPRIASPVPMVVDEFETEAKREIAASAGLTGGEAAVAGQSLSLVHQVSVYDHVSIYLNNNDLFFFARSVIKLQFRLGTTTCLYPNTFPLQNLPVNIRSPWTLSKKLPFKRSSATRVFSFQLIQAPAKPSSPNMLSRNAFVTSSA